MDDHQLLRYSRHILLDEIGIEGQEKLLGAYTPIVDCGSLSIATLPYLAVSGISRLTIADPDAIDDTNLQRRITSTEADTGQPKALVMEGHLKNISSQAGVTTLPGKLTEVRLIELMRATDIALGYCDDFPTRRTINRAAVVTRTPLVSGATMRLDSQTAVYRPDLLDSPCYVCLSGGDTADDGTCILFDVFSSLVGIIGITQAAEALKILADIDTLTHGKLMTYDALAGKWRTFRLERHPKCRVCGGKR